MPPVLSFGKFQHRTLGSVGTQRDRRLLNPFLFSQGKLIARRSPGQLSTEVKMHTGFGAGGRGKPQLHCSRTVEAWPGRFICLSVSFLLSKMGKRPYFTELLRN